MDNIAYITVYLSTHLSVSPPTYLSISVSILSLIYMYIYPVLYLSVSIYLSASEYPPYISTSTTLVSKATNDPKQQPD